MFRKKQKLRREYDQKLIDLMEKTKTDWLHHKHLEELTYEQDEYLSCRMLISKAKYFFLFQEAKKRKISLNK